MLTLKKIYTIIMFTLLLASNELSARMLKSDTSKSSFVSLCWKVALVDKILLHDEKVKNSHCDIRFCTKYCKKHSEI